MTPTFPQEIVDMIIDQLAVVDANPKFSELLVCSKICRSWAFSARRHIFKFVTLNGVANMEFFRLLVPKREAVSIHIRTISFNDAAWKAWIKEFAYKNLQLTALRTLQLRDVELGLLLRGHACSELSTRPFTHLRRLELSAVVFSGEGIHPSSLMARFSQLEEVSLERVYMINIPNKPKEKASKPAGFRTLKVTNQSTPIVPWVAGGCDIEDFRCREMNSRGLEVAQAALRRMRKKLRYLELHHHEHFRKGAAEGIFDFSKFPVLETLHLTVLSSPTWLCELVPSPELRILTIALPKFNFFIHSGSDVDPSKWAIVDSHFQDSLFAGLEELRVLLPAQEEDSEGLVIRKLLSSAESRGILRVSFLAKPKRTFSDPIVDGIMGVW
ncbi:hypothetical protein C8J56DRAFT_1059870 [Mycena floridula]|nr:hypothetical protein C8J56DRAFT_1059870 [Mycena floridula]